MGVRELYVQAPSDIFKIFILTPGRSAVTIVFKIFIQLYSHQAMSRRARREGTASRERRVAGVVAPVSVRVVPFENFFL